METKNLNELKELKLKTKEWAFYKLLESDPKKWWSKEEIISQVPDYELNKNETSHDICAALNTARLKLNNACSSGIISHYVLLDNNSFKLANEEEMNEEIKKMEKNLWKLYIRYLGAKGVIKLNNQGKIIDCKGKVIEEDSLAKRFYEPFNFDD